jgi:hypothetical protein
MADRHPFAAVFLGTCKLQPRALLQGTVHSCIYGLAVHLNQKLVGTLFNVPVPQLGVSRAVPGLPESRPLTSNCHSGIMLAVGANLQVAATPPPFAL